MNLQNIWNSIAVADAAAALASLTMCAAFARRVQLRTNSIALLITLFALTGFLSVAGIDAFLHTNPGTEARWIAGCRRIARPTVPKVHS